MHRFLATPLYKSAQRDRNLTTEDTMTYPAPYPSLEALPVVYSEPKVADPSPTGKGP